MDEKKWYQKIYAMFIPIAIVLFIVIVGTALSSITPNAQNDETGYGYDSIEDEFSQDETTTETTETTTETTPPEPAKTWSSIATIEGSANKKSDTFELTGEKVKVNYHTEGSDYNDAYLYLKGTDGSSEDIATTNGTMKDSTFLYPVAGEYYFDISVANNTKYKLELFEYK